MANIRQQREKLIKRILKGTGKVPSAERLAAYENRGPAGAAAPLIDKVAKNAWKVTDADIDAARTAGLSEDQIFEIVICAAVGQASLQYDAALTALDAATEKS